MRCRWTRSFTAWNGIAVEGGNADGSSPALRVFNYMSPGYLETMGMRVVAGRDLTWADLEETRPVALVSESLARELWQTPEAAIGRRIRGDAGGPWREVVGVVAGRAQQRPRRARRRRRSIGRR